MNKKASYFDIIQYCETCLQTHGDSHKGVGWPYFVDAQIRYKVMLDIMKESKNAGERVKLLDFGCGAAHLYAYILANQYTIDYCGLDLSEKFIALCRNKYPLGKFLCADVLKDGLAGVPTVDYIVFNGIFTFKYDMPFADMMEYFQRVLTVMFPKARKGLAFNVMSKAVDWERDDLFHVSADILIEFLTKNLSRHFVIRNDYGLYEYTTYLYKTPQEEESSYFPRT